MPGRCSSCAHSFGLFRKERGCSNCGFSFCGKCCEERKIPGADKRRRLLCNGCFQSLSTPSSTTTSDAAPAKPSTRDWEPPENLLKRERLIAGSSSNAVSAATTRANGPTAVGMNPSKPRDLGHDWSIGLGPEDLEIKKRLEKLKEAPKTTTAEETTTVTTTTLPETTVTTTTATTPSTATSQNDGATSGPVDDDQLAARVRQLRGLGDQGPAAPRQNLPPAEKRTRVEQVDDLLREIADEVTLDDSHRSDLVDPIENRLKKLKGEEESGEEMKKDAENSGGAEGGAENANDGFSTSAGEKMKGREKSEEKEDDLDEISRLMAKTAAQLEEDAKRELKELAKDDQVRQRLGELRRYNERRKDETGEEEEEKAEEDEDDEEEEKEAERVMKKLVEEAKLEDDLEADGGSVRPSVGSGFERIDLKKPLESLGRQVTRAENAVDGSQRLPWCVICNEDAVWSCPECEGDLFCSRCFEECHRDEKHEPRKFEPGKDGIAA